MMADGKTDFIPHNGIMKPRKDGGRYEGKDHSLICRQ